MPEELTLTTPSVIPAKTTTGYKVKLLLLDVEGKRFLLAVRGTNGEAIEAERKDAAAISLMQQLNTANGTVKSLHRRALEWFATQPEGAGFSGTITGSPD